MSGGGEVRVLRQEPGQESPRMPAWKREILERRKAKGGGGAGVVAVETTTTTSTSSNGGGGSGGAGSSSPRVNGEQTGNVNGNSGPKSGGGTGRSYTITTASQHFSSNNKETTDALEREDDRHESLVLQESLGPLDENPFIKLEKERRRRQDRETVASTASTARPVQHILELYGSVPGIRTIRAENIIIIESDPDYFPEAGGFKPSKWQQNGVSSYSSLNDLLDRRGSAVTEIRAKEVVIYDTTLSKSEENLSTLGHHHHHHEAPSSSSSSSSYGTGDGHGRVSRMLQKFDSNYGKLQKKSHSTENLLDLDSSSRPPPRLWSRPQPDLVPKVRPLGPSPSVSSSQPSSPVFQSPTSSKPKPLSELGSPQRSPGSPQPVSSYRQRFEESGGDEPDWGQTKPVRERDWEGSEMPPKPKVPCSPETRRIRAESPTSPIVFKVSRSSSDFEIRPSPKPDLTQIPDGDSQARALANLRLQSRNSFTVIPKRRVAPSSATSSPTPSSPVRSSPSHRVAKVSTPGVPTSHAPMPMVTPSMRIEEKLQEEKEVERPSKPEPSPPVATSPPPPPTSEPRSPSPAPHSPPALSSPPSSPVVPSSPSFSLVPSDSPAPSPVPSTPSPAPEQPPVDQLPVTNIDDIEVEPQQRVPAPSPGVQRRKGNTFTVVPKRRAEAEGQPSSPEPPQQEASSEAPPGSTPPQAPYAQLGSLLKKRYPAVEEIEVVGGYLSLAKSCISKMGSMGKKLKISFNESSLHSTYEYPSESSVWDSEDEDEEEKRDGRVADEQPSMVGRIHIPRPSFTSSPTHTNNSNDLSSYIPKHSVDFSAWQEHKHDDSVYQEDSTSQQTQTTEEVMLTPADSSSLSDYSSEPALYF
ncbi:taperin [Sebastes umbrosus]|uniref:taperin n=1 Tax=Sebastes umbrosus TaxID=72105 RepID=UPI00189D7161|nr:taperin [Sebastes umbrosus]